jgi:hypothetical protein
LASLWEQPVPLSLQILSYANIVMNLFKDKIQKLKLSISTSDISLGYNNGIQLAKFGLLIDRTS